MSEGDEDGGREGGREQKIASGSDGISSRFTNLIRQTDVPDVFLSLTGKSTLQKTKMILIYHSKLCK